MDIVFLVLIVIVFIDFVGTLKEMEEVIDELISKHNSMVKMVNTLNNRIHDIEKGAR